MLKVVFLSAVLAVVALSAPATKSIDTYVSPPTVVVTPVSSNATVKYVKHHHRATLNFACNVERITVTPNFDNFQAGFEDPLTQIELEDHIGEPNNIEWAHVMQMNFQSIDPRGQDRQLGTLGGDLGEFLLVLSAIETQLGKEFTKADVSRLFQLYLTVMSREKFFYSIDVAAVNNLKEACGCPQLNIADPPESKKQILLNSTHTAGSHGDEFFKKLLSNPAPFGVRAALVHHTTDAFFGVMWNKTSPLHRRIKFVLLKGELAPKGFIMVKTPGYCNAQLLAPMISPELCQKQMGIYHGDAAVLLRTEIAGVLLSKTPEEKNAVVRKANEMASTALSTVLADHTEPVYTVSFEGF